MARRAGSGRLVQVQFEEEHVRNREVLACRNHPCVCRLAPYRGVCRFAQIRPCITNPSKHGWKGSHTNKDFLACISINVSDCLLE